MEDLEISKMDNLTLLNEVCSINPFRLLMVKLDVNEMYNNGAITRTEHEILTLLMELAKRVIVNRKFSY